MKRLIDWILPWYMLWLECLYFPLAFKAIYNATTAGYDTETGHQRADEAIGLQMLDDFLTRDFRIIAVRPMTVWEAARAVRIGRTVVDLLLDAGWTGDRINRRVDQVSAKVNLEMAVEQAR